MEPRIGDPQVPASGFHDRRPILTPHLVFGLIIIAVGVLFTLDNLGIIYAEDYWRWWPIGLIAVGVAKLWQSWRGAGNPVGGMFFVVVGSWFLFDNLGVISRDLWNFWPLLLVFIGSMIVYQGVRGKQARATAGSADTISGVAILGGWKRNISSPAFRGGELTAVMGGCEVDLRNAGINGDAVIEVFAMWGGIEIRLPEDWTLINRVTAVMGAVEDNSRPPQAPTPHRLTLRGFVMMGGVEIKN